MGAVLTFKCDAQGAYAFDLGVGKYDVYAQNDYLGDMDYLGTAAVDEHTEDGDLHHILVDGGISLSPPMLDAALDAMQRAEAAAAQSASDRQQTGADALTTAQNRAVATDKAAEAAQSAVLSAEARDSIVQDAAEVRAKAEQVSLDTQTVAADRQSVQQNAEIVASNTTTAITQAQKATSDALAAQQDRELVSGMLAEVTSKTGQAVAAADTASQKAVLAAQSEASAKADADRAENAAGSMTGAILDGGTCDLSAGVYPTPIAVNGSPYSTVWYVQTGGIVSGVTFDAGDLLRYTTANGGQYFRVDAKDEVYSVQGEKGAVVLTPEKIGAEPAGVAETLLQQHEAKAGAHGIAGVQGLGAELGSINQALSAIQKLAASLEASPYRNKIVDGRFDFWHEGTSQTTSGYGSDTMWINLHSGSAKTASRLALQIGNSLPNVDNPSVTFAARTNVASVTGANNYVRKAQKIESARTLAGKKATLSFYAKADADKDLGVHVEQSFGTGGLPSATTVVLSTKLAITSQWVRYSLTFDIPSVAGKTLGSNGNDCLNVIFGFDQGASLSSMMGGLGHQSGTFDIACVQLEEGEQATKFEELPLSIAAAMVGRYFETSYPIGTPIGTPSYVLGAVAVCNPKSTIYVYGASTLFKYEKVATPVVSLRSTGGGVNNTVLNITTATTGNATAKDISPIGFAYIQLFDTPAAANDFRFHYVADARP